MLFNYFCKQSGGRWLISRLGKEEKQSYLDRRILFIYLFDTDALHKRTRVVFAPADIHILTHTRVRFLSYTCV